MFFVHVGEDVNSFRVQFFPFAYQLGGAAVIEFARVPYARAGENADANPASAGGDRDREADRTAVVNYVDAHGHRKVFDHFGGGDGVCRHRFRLYVVANVVGKVPHIFDGQAVHAALHQRFGVAKSVVDNFLCMP